MISQISKRWWRCGLAGMLGLFILTGPGPALPRVIAQTNGGANEALRSYLQLQEQLHETQLALERNRQETEALAAKNAEANAARFRAIENALTTQRGVELQAMQDSLKTMKESMERNSVRLYTVGGAIAVVGFLVLLLTGYLQWRSINRVSEFAVLIQNARAALPSLAEPALLGSGEAAKASGRMFSTLSQLEKRILELEHTAHPALPEAKAVTLGTGTNGVKLPLTNGEPHGEDQFASLIEKAQALLASDQPAQAVECYDQILRQAPEHAEVLVKKGIALEALRRTDEALQCYDHAITANADLTIAYLQKGGLFNRLERYEEALQCYEQALHAQEKAHAA